MKSAKSADTVRLMFQLRNTKEQNFSSIIIHCTRNENSAL